MKAIVLEVATIAILAATAWVLVMWMGSNG